MKPRYFFLMILIVSAIGAVIITPLAAFVTFIAAGFWLYFLIKDIKANPKSEALGNRPKDVNKGPPR